MIRHPQCTRFMLVFVKICQEVEEFCKYFKMKTLGNYTS